MIGARSDFAETQPFFTDDPATMAMTTWPGGR
jgi:hypothetical protein